MAFFGVEVKPGNPFTHHPPNARRLHLSQATLGKANETQKSTLQCNVGNEGPVFLCSLIPEKAVCCQLNLEFEEKEEVIFSVIGPTSVHITGYYMTVFFPSQPERNEGNQKHMLGTDNGLMVKEKSEEVIEEERFPLADHVDHGNFGIEQSEHTLKLATNDCTDGEMQNNPLLDSNQVGLEDSAKLYGKRGGEEEKTSINEVKKEDEDLKDGSDFGAINQDVHVEEKEIEEQVNTEDGNLQQDLLLSSTQVCPENGTDGSTLGSKSEDQVEGEALKGNVVEEVEDGSNLGAMNLNVHLEDNETQKHVNSSQDNVQYDLPPASTQMGVEDETKRKRKRQEKEVEQKTLEGYIAKESEGQKNGSNVDVITQDMDVEDEGTQKQVNATKRKKKKGCKNKEVVVDIDSEKADDKAIPLPNELIVEELEVGKSDGEIASVGKKVQIRYKKMLIGESGEQLDSAAKKTLKFRLGQEGVHKVWNVGLEGMRIGGKRKLTVPSSMCCASEGAAETDTIQSNSWQVYEVVLRSVK